jgi:carboxymethylenebutenolidase
MTEHKNGPYAVKTRTIQLAASDGVNIPAFVAEPQGAGPFPAVTFGAEAMGINSFNRGVATDLAARGYVTIVADYYRGRGPSNPENYDDFTEVMTAIEALDFRQATFDVLAGADWLRAHPQVDPLRIAVWGYCTGGTLAVMAACLDRNLAAAVWFFPSQPTFEQLTVKRPAHAIDMVWSITCPVIVIYGSIEADHIAANGIMGRLRDNFDKWKIRNEIRIYPGAGHAFSAPTPKMHNAEATRNSWADATAFLERTLAESFLLPA